MPVSDIISTPAHPQANSYVSVAETDQFYEDKFGTFTWESADANDKKRALIEATRLVDSVRFHYEKLTDQKQNLKWPRTNADCWTGTPDSATTNSITDSNIANKRDFPDDYWNYGAIWFYGEDDANFNKYYLVTDFDAATGTITIDGTFDNAVLTSDSYELISKIPNDIKEAVMETADALLDELILNTSTGNIKRQKLDTEEVEYFDRSVQDIQLPAKAMALLRKYISTSGRVRVLPKFR